MYYASKQLFEFSSILEKLIRKKRRLHFINSFGLNILKKSTQLDVYSRSCFDFKCHCLRNSPIKKMDFLRMDSYVVFLEAHTKITSLAKFQNKSMFTLVLTGIQSSKKAKKAKTCPMTKITIFSKRNFKFFFFLPEMIKYFKLTENIEKKIFGPYPT